jgi:uncharacterized membrane protein YfcA
MTTFRPPLQRLVGSSEITMYDDSGSNALVDFSKRLSRVAAIATWGGIVLALIGAVVLHEQHDSSLRLHFYAFLGWQALAVVNDFAWRRRALS